MRLAAELTRLETLSPPLHQKLPLSIEHLNPAIALIGDIHPAFSSDRDPAGQIEFAIAVAVLAPLAQWFSRGAKCGDLVPFSFFVVPRWRNAEVGHVNVAVTVERDPAGKRRNRKRGQEL